MQDSDIFGNHYPEFYSGLFNFNHFVVINSFTTDPFNIFVETECKDNKK
jgi:hypothetical protein